ncbi:hypothetical protein NECAME_03283 [Necator americanus]|uniref:Uncharacterized protein n=1 Tax=Necator americanus TaxID=51031 RepID=W2T5J8_NECAM|nr:hypothetical protein NECAME_03283 [Necator americanus]ETN77183.1 hypothetical protein NECAME_03283 [Necator americanus]
MPSVPASPPVEIPAASSYGQGAVAPMPSAPASPPVEVPAASSYGQAPMASPPAISTEGSEASFVPGPSSQGGGTYGGNSITYGGEGSSGAGGYSQGFRKKCKFLVIAIHEYS